MPDGGPPEPRGPGDDEPVNPFAGLPLFGDLAKMFQGAGVGDPWVTARQLARTIAVEGSPEGNVDPSRRIRLEELARVAELQVQEITGLRTDRSAGVEVMTRSAWVDRTLDDWRPLFERLGAGLAPPPPDDAGLDPAAQLLGGMMKMLAPMMLGLSAGSLVGHLGGRALGDYELPLPRPPRPPGVVPTNLDAFAGDWQLDADNLGLWVCVEQLTFTAVLGIDHVAGAVTDLVTAYVGAFSTDPDALDRRLGGIDPQSLMDPSGLQELFGDPEVLLGAIRSAEQEALLPRIGAAVSVLFAYVDHVLDEAGSRLIGNYGSLAEALRRRRVDATPADRFVERLLGVELTPAGMEAGQAFVSGVLARAGRDGLARLWSEPGHLPTPSELQAPGLWLARIDLP